MWVSSTSGARRRQSRVSSRRHGKSILQSSLIGVAAVAAGLSLAAPVRADVATIENEELVAPNITVLSNYNEYTEIRGQPGDLWLTVKFSLDAGFFGRIKSWTLWPQAMNLDMPGQHDFKDSSQSSTYIWGARPKSTTDRRILIVPRSAYADYVVSACNRLAEIYRARGFSDAQIFDRDRNQMIFLGGALTYEMTGIPGDTVLPGKTEYLQPLKVICAKSEPPSRAPVQEIVTSALAVTETSNLSACRLNTAGSITSLRPSQTVEFRYVDQSGKKSDIKTVTTSPAKIANFTHQLPLAGDGGAMSGKIRMVGENFEFESPWADYDLNCNVAAGSGDKAVDQLPKIKILEAETIQEVIFGGRWACPSLVKVRGQVSGHGPGVAAVALFDKNSTSGSLFGPEEFEVQQGSEETFAANHDISWQPPSASSGSPMPQEVSYLARARMNVGTSESFVADEDEFDRTLRCRPVWPQATIKVEVLETAAIGGGFVCPVRYLVSGNLVGRNSARVDVELSAGEERFGPFAYDLAEGNQAGIGPFERTLAWKGGLGNAVPQQTTAFSLKVTGKPDVHLVTEKRTEVFRCSPSAEIAGGALPSAPRANVPAGQVRVMGDRIVMGGGQPNAIYLLQFHHQSKLGGRFERVKEPYLPTKALTGVATLNRSAMEPGRWRVEACATRGGKGTQALPGACSTADFEVQKKAAHSLKVHVAGGTIRLQGAQPNAVYLLMFHHQSKLGGKFKRVKASHLPTKAKGGVAKATLAKMSPGQWRVEVCATQGGRGVRMLPGSCIPGSFEVRRAAIGGFGEAFQ